jgi:hypothetical protein
MITHLSIDEHPRPNGIWVRHIAGFCFDFHGLRGFKPPGGVVISEKVLAGRTLQILEALEWTPLGSKPMPAANRKGPAMDETFNGIQALFRPPSCGSWQFLLKNPAARPGCGARRRRSGGRIGGKCYPWSMPCVCGDAKIERRLVLPQGG